MVVLLILPICLFVCLGMRKAEKPVERSPATEAIKMLNNPNDHSEIARLFDKLRSPSEWKRERAKRQFLKLGPAAISPLLDFLRDLTSNRVPRFRTGEEQQGQAALETYCSLLAREGSRSPHLEEAGARLDNLAINYRLSSDIIALLGELKAEEAVPFLIKRMVYVGIDDPYAITEEIKALQAIGLAAVPYLMKEIREIESKVRSSSIEEVNFNYRIGCELHIES
jgi:HEAT repeat protein